MMWTRITTSSATPLDFKLAACQDKHYVFTPAFNSVPHTITIPAALALVQMQVSARWAVEQTGRSSG